MVKGVSRRVVKWSTQNGLNRPSFLPPGRGRRRGRAGGASAETGLGSGRLSSSHLPPTAADLDSTRPALAGGGVASVIWLLPLGFSSSLLIPPVVYSGYLQNRKGESAMHNVILIGMPGVGKSTLVLLAKTLA